MQMADAFIRTGMYKRILLVGAELHSHSLDYSTRGRDVMVLFGDGAGAMVLGPQETDDPRAGILTHLSFTALYALPGRSSPTLSRHPRGVTQYLRAG